MHIYYVYRIIYFNDCELHIDYTTHLLGPGLLNKRLDILPQTLEKIRMIRYWTIRVWYKISPFQRYWSKRTASKYWRRTLLSNVLSRCQARSSTYCAPTRVVHLSWQFWNQQDGIFWYFYMYHAFVYSKIIPSLLPMQIIKETLIVIQDIFELTCAMVDHTIPGELCQNCHQENYLTYFSATKVIHCYILS